jgi:hypothetical protein
VIKRILLTVLPAVLLSPIVTFAQNPALDVTQPASVMNAKDDKDKEEAPKVETVATYSLSGYIDVYYAQYSDSVGPGNFQKFPSLSPRSNSPSLNTAMLTFQYNADKIRTQIALQYGDIASSTWAPTYGPVMEAHAGVKICKKLWIDGGLFRTHFGTEYLLPVENIASSVSVGTYYEPYYESGIRLNYSPTKKFDINVYLLNGYGIYNDNNEKKSLGAALTYTFNDKWNIGYTDYIGDDSQPGTTVKHLRVHQNAYVNYQKKKWRLQVGGDYCIQENSKLTDAKKSANMFSALATIKYQATKAFAVYARGEVFQDPDAIMSNNITDEKGKATGYKLWGATAGAEYKPTTGSYIKLEGRMLQMDDNQWIFHYNNAPQNSRFEVMVHAGISFDIIKGVINSAK